MRRDGSGSDADTPRDQRDAAASRTLRRIAAALGVGVSTFFEASPGAPPGRPRSRIEQAEALLGAFDRIADPRIREHLIALVEAQVSPAPEVSLAPEMAD